MATGHEDFMGYVEIFGEYLGAPVQVALTSDGDAVIVWVD